MSVSSFFPSSSPLILGDGDVSRTARSAVRHSNEVLGGKSASGLIPQGDRDAGKRSANRISSETRARSGFAVFVRACVNMGNAFVCNFAEETPKHSIKAG